MKDIFKIIGAILFGCIIGFAISYIIITLVKFLFCIEL